MVVAVIAAVAAGAMFAVGTVLQQRAARAAPPDEALSPALIVWLAHRRSWLLGVGASVASFGMQALALSSGPIALVQPLIVCELLFAVPIAVRLRRRRLGAREWLGTLAVAGGLAMFAAVAAPHGGHADPPMTHWALVLGIGGAVAVGAVALGRVVRGPARASLVALAAGAAFGLLAALTKSSTFYLGEGAVAFFTAWQPYSMAAVAAFGMVVQQSAFQAGPPPASLPVMDAVEPTMAVLVGILAFGEHVAHTPLALAAEVVGLLVLVTGIVVLDRSPLLVELQAPSGDSPEQAGEDDAAAGGQPASRARISSA